MNGIVNICVGAVAGFLSRPCCVRPAAMSFMGVGTAGLAHAAVAYRPAFLAVSGVMLALSVWLTFRRPGGRFLKSLTVAATLVAFVWTTGVL